MLWANPSHPAGASSLDPARPSRVRRRDLAACSPHLARGVRRRSRSEGLEKRARRGQGADGRLQRLGRGAAHQRLHRLGGRGDGEAFRRQGRAREARRYGRGGAAGAGRQDGRHDRGRRRRPRLDQRRQLRRDEEERPPVRPLGGRHAQLCAHLARDPHGHHERFHRAGRGARKPVGPGPGRVLPRPRCHHRAAPLDDELRGLGARQSRPLRLSQAAGFPRPDVPQAGSARA
jgi:hypothetical protein